MKVILNCQDEKKNFFDVARQCQNWVKKHVFLDF